MYEQLIALVLAAGRNPCRVGWICSSTRSRHRLPLLTPNPADFADLGPLFILIGLDDR